MNNKKKVKLLNNIKKCCFLVIMWNLMIAYYYTNYV